MKDSIYKAICQYQPKTWPVTLGQSCFISLDESSGKAMLKLPFPQPSLLNDLKAEFNLQDDDIEYHFDIVKMQSMNSTAGNANIKNMIAVSSGKGGVGKSTLAFELALALKQLGAKVGILDADIHGPSQPSLLAVTQHEMTSCDGKLMDPVTAMGIVANSIGFLVEPENATIWRGPMASKVLMQLYQETNWPELDYLIVDMPPGTSDIQLTLGQSLPVTAAIVVTTPQELAVLDAVKGIAMFNKLDLPVLGIVENMSYFDCGCGSRHYPFGQQGIDSLLEQNNTVSLGALPIFSNGEGRGHERYLDIAEQASARLWFEGRVAKPMAEGIEVKVL